MAGRVALWTPERIADAHHAILEGRRERKSASCIAAGLSIRWGLPVTGHGLNCMLQKHPLPRSHIPEVPARDTEKEIEVGIVFDSEGPCDTPIPIERPLPHFERDGRLKSILIVPDTHRPFHCPKAWALALAVGQVIRPDAIVVLGDFGDFYKVSDHVKDPKVRMSFEEELADINEGLDDLDKLGASQKFFQEGNHEFRLQRHLWKNSPELAALPSLQVPELFRLKERGWSFSAYQDFFRIGKMCFTHDDDNAGDQAHAKARASYESNVVIGHTHRIGMQVRGNLRGEAHIGAMFGWLGDVTRIDYTKRAKAKQWAHGVGIGYLDTETEAVYLRPIPFVNGTAEVNGEKITA